MRNSRVHALVLILVAWNAANALLEDDTFRDAPGLVGLALTACVTFALLELGVILVRRWLRTRWRHQDAHRAEFPPSYLPARFPKAGYRPPNAGLPSVENDRSPVRSTTLSD
ncbi:hypothetical protein AYO38_04950 [bacterium SCGC AG-212-C10]|nr:hypothetical protein AYO38_04950 [bacterium SCGC AG-212-C10]